MLIRSLSWPFLVMQQETHEWKTCCFDEMNDTNWKAWDLRKQTISPSISSSAQKFGEVWDPEWWPRGQSSEE